MENLLKRLDRDEVLLSDGALGSILLEWGLKLGECPEMLNLERPEWITKLARSYLEAGADFLTTNTFGASPLKLKSFGLSERMEEINRRAVNLVRDVASDRAYVAGSIGPTGKLLKPYGPVDPTEVLESYQKELEVVIDAGADVIFIETMTDLAEALLAVKAVRAVSASIPIMATMTFDKTPRGFYTIMGTTIEAAVKGLAEAGANIVGSNCGNGSDTMLEVARAFKTCSPVPVAIQSNAGLPEIQDGKVIYRETPDFMAERVAQMIEAGIRIVGGCCGTTPEHIRAFRALLG